MKPVRTLIVAGAAAGLAATAGIAFAVSPPQHTLSVALPGGGTAEIRYAGDVAPQVSFKDVPARTAFLAPGFEGDPFAQMQQMSAAMDRRMTDLMSRLNAPGAALKAGGFDTADLPAGSQVTTISNPSPNAAGCMRSIEITQNGGEKPKVVERSAGNCGDAAAPDAPAQPSGPRHNL